MILLSLPLKLCFAAVVWPPSLCLSGVISNHSLLTASPCMVSHAKASAKNSVSLLLSWICSWPCRLWTQWLNQFTLKSHRNRLTLTHGFVGYSEYPEKILPRQRGWGLGFEFSFPGKNPVVTTGQQCGDTAVTCVATSHVFEPWNWAFKLNCKWKLPVLEGNTFSAGSGTAQGSCRQWQITSLGEAVYNRILFKAWGAGRAPNWGNNCLKTYSGKPRAFFSGISMDGEGHEWVFSVFIWCDQAVCRRCWLLYK